MKGYSDPMYHVSQLEKHYSESIALSVVESKVYDTVRCNTNMSAVNSRSGVITLADEDTIECAKRMSAKYTKVAVLNFASYKNPGGLYMEGSTAQEEAICAESTLYPVLKSFESTYYRRNNKDLNKGLYRNVGIYSPDIKIVDLITYEELASVDVITCAAPNVKRGLRYGSISEMEAEKHMKSRIAFVLGVAIREGVDCLVLGAYGCGVFGNDPQSTAKLFKELLIDMNVESFFSEVVFAIPKANVRGLDNYDWFSASGMFDIEVSHLKYRPHGGGTVYESLEEEKMFNSIEELFEYLVKDHKGAFKKEDLLIDAEVSFDKRINRYTQLVCTNKYFREDYIKKYKTPQCIGYCDLSKLNK